MTYTKFKSFFPVKLIAALNAQMGVLRMMSSAIMIVYESSGNIGYDAKS